MPRYADSDIISAVNNNTTMAGVCRDLGIKPSGGSHYHISNRVRKMGLDTSHFKLDSWNKGKTFQPRQSADEILVRRDPELHRAKSVTLRRALSEVGVEERCVECGLGAEWRGRPIQLEVDHIDGDCYNNTKQNLRYLCPNCHSQCETNRPWKNRLLYANPAKQPDLDSGVSEFDSLGEYIV